MNNAEFIATLQAKKAEALEVIKSVDALLAFFQGGDVTKETEEPSRHNGVNGNSVKENKSLPKLASGYKGNYREKAAFILKEAGRFLHIREIVELAQNYEPKANPDTLAGSIRQAVYSLKNMENSPIVTVRVNNINMNTFWGSKNWLDGEGNIKPEHKYNEAFLVGANKEPIEI
jgi:hypothetical protein